MSALPRKRVLVVDDEPTIRALIAEALRDASFEVCTAANGAEGLELLRRWVADAVVLDLMMPRLDGLGFVELVRLNPNLASVPIVLVTAAYGAREAAEQVGAQAVLTKPFELDVLVETVKRVAGAGASAVDDIVPSHLRIPLRGQPTGGFAAGDS